MEAIIVEDEVLAARDLKSLIQKIAPEIKVLQILNSLRATKAWLTKHSEPELIFMDIQLADGVSFELFKSIQVNCPIIFTTAYDQYAIRAFQVNSVDYLLKPIDPEDLARALKKLKKIKAYQSSEHLDQGMKDLIKDLTHPTSLKTYKERFLVSFKNKLVPISLDDIAYFTKDEIIFIVSKDGKRYISDYQTLDEIEGLLDPQLFFRANRQYILHINAIGSLSYTHKGINVQLKAPHLISLDVSRLKAPSFKDWVDQ